MANEDVGFRARGPRNQYIPPITEENLRDNAYATMKKGGKVVKKKGKATATATAIVNVYTGRRGKSKAQPRPPKPPQPINVSVQMPNYMSSFDPRFRPHEPFQNIRFSENIEQPIRIAKTEEPFKSVVPLSNLTPLFKSVVPLSNLTPLSQSGLINRGEPMKEQGDYEPSYLINRGEPMKEQGDYERPQIKRLIVKEEPQIKLKDPYEPLNLKNLFTESSFGNLKKLPRDKDPMEMKQLEDYPHIRFVELGRPNVGEPIRQQDSYEPYDPIEMKHEKEPDELIVMEQDLQPYTPYQVDTPPYVMTPPESPEAEAVGDEAPIRRKRRTKEEMEIARLAKEETKRIKEEAKQKQEEAKKRLAELKEEQDTERLFNQIRQVRMEIVKRQREDPNHPQLLQLRKQLDKLTKK